MLALVAIIIVSGTIFYSQYLAKKIAREERQKVEQWVEAGKFLIYAPINADITFASRIVTENNRYLLLKPMKRIVSLTILTWIPHR